MMDWNTIPWRKLERKVFKLQKRIYRASARGDVKTVRRLQKTLMRSWMAKCLAVRRVTQDNQGKKTAGVDGVKALRPKKTVGTGEPTEDEPKGTSDTKGFDTKTWNKGKTPVRNTHNVRQGATSAS